MLRLIIILGLDVQAWDGDKIGSPTNLEQANLPTAPAAGTVPAPANGNVNGGGDRKPAVGAASRAAPARPAARMGSKDMGPIYPIEGLSPYQNK
jgi:replication factor A1